MTDNADHRRSHIIETATAVFLRYGFTRTTMADIARAADLTRPTLYATFPDKEAIFQAVVSSLMTGKLARIEAAIAGLPELQEKLSFACQAWAGEGYDLLQNLPDARDVYDLRFSAVADGYRRFQAILADIVGEHLVRSSLGQSPASLAHSIIYALKGFKDGASSRKELEQLVADYVAIVVAAIRQTTSVGG